MKGETSQKKKAAHASILNGSQGGDDEKRPNLYFPQ
jgi:hypothetical protein